MSARQSCPHCGCELKSSGKARSYQQLKRVMALCRAAYMHWPEHDPFRPRSESHLRYFLEKEAGYFQVEKTIRLDGIDSDKLFAILSAVLRTSEDIKQFIELDGTLLVVKRVGSIGYEGLGHSEACALFNEIDAVLHARGFSAEKLLSETEKAA